jgi:hypothetical protein
VVWKNEGRGGTKLKADGTFYCDMRGSGSDDLVWIYEDGNVDEINTNIHNPPNWGHDTDIHLSVPGPRNGIHLADFNGDGRCDVVVQDKATGDLTYWKNNYDQAAKVISFEKIITITGFKCAQGWGVSPFDRGMRLHDIE